jgi:hypothetical protein
MKCLIKQQNKSLLRRMQNGVGLIKHKETRMKIWMLFDAAGEVVMPGASQQ